MYVLVVDWMDEIPIFTARSMSDPKVLPRSIWQQDSEAPECMSCHTPFEGHTTPGSNRGTRAFAKASSFLHTVKSGNRCAPKRALDLCGVDCLKRLSRRRACFNEAHTKYRVVLKMNLYTLAHTRQIFIKKPLISTT